MQCLHAILLGVELIFTGLETESQYLSNRLSSSGFHEYELNEIPPSPLSPTYSMASGSGATPNTHPIRTRTKSTPFFDIPPNPSSSPIPVEYTQQAGPSRITIPIPSRPTQQIRRPSQNSSYEVSTPPSRIPRLQPTARRPSGTSSLSDNSSLSESYSPKITPNRPLTRPRSKTTLQGRPTPGRSSSGSSQERRTPVSAQKQRSNSSTKLSGEGWGNDREILAHRESFDLSRQEYPSTYLRDELPPFRLAPDEAMRIARSGHKLEGENGDTGLEGDEETREGEEEDSRSKRKRVESMFPIQSQKVVGERRKGSADELGYGSGIPRSTPIKGSIGLGQASSRMPKGVKVGSSIPRSATGGVRAALSSSQTSTSRSISLNHSLSARSTSPVPTPPRMGVAAHLVPPESAYTPPKGANWDDVVLPALARKMGLGDDKRVGVDEMEEGDLAVEWDRNGTPVKWVKRQASPRLPQGPEIPNGKADRRILEESERYINGPRSGTAFSPSFEPSPDNPLHESTNHGRETSNESKISEPTPTPSPSRPMRTSHDPAVDTDLSSPAPFSTLPRQSSRGPHALRESQTESGSGDGSGLGRKPSFLRQKLSAKGSAAELRMKGSSNSLRPGDMGRQGISQATTKNPTGMGRPGEAPWGGSTGHTPGMPSRTGTIPTNWEQGPSEGISQAGKQGAKGKAGDHGGG